MVTTSYSSEQMDEVWSWVHDERKCVTSFTVAMRLGVSRTVASLLLRDLPLHQENNNDIMYEVTKTTWIEKECKDGTKQTVIKLVVDITNIVSEDSIVYSIAIQGSQNLLTAHEMQKIDPLTLNCHILSTDLNTARIAPAMDIVRISLGVGRFANIDLPETAPATNTFLAKPRKLITAASFFGKEETNDKKSVTVTKTEKPTETNMVEPPKVKPTKIIEVKKPPKKSIFGNTPISKTIAIKERLSDNEKENTDNKVVGTADDFVGDRDEDEEFLVEEQDRKRRNEVQQKDTEEKERRREQAMAVRAAKEQKQEQEQPIMEQPQKSKKRRKRLVEKTTMDANGYLRTETQAIWEEMSDEDEVAVKKVPVKKVSAKNGMKQGSLMGFFGKK